MLYLCQASRKRRRYGPHTKQATNKWRCTDCSTHTSPGFCFFFLFSALLLVLLCCCRRQRYLFIPNMQQQQQQQHSEHGMCALVIGYYCYFWFGVVGMRTGAWPYRHTNNTEQQQPRQKKRRLPWAVSYAMLHVATSTNTYLPARSN